MYAGETTGAQPSLQFFGAGIGGQLDGKGDHPAWIYIAQGHELFKNTLRAVVFHRLRGLLVIELTGTREQQFQMVVQFGHGADGGTRAAHRVGLIDCNCRRHALDFVYRRAVHAVQKLTRVGAESFHVTPLSFGVQGVKHQAGFARTAGTGEHRQLVGSDVDVNVFEIVLTGTTYAYKTLAHAAIIHRGRRPALLDHATGFWLRLAC